MDNLTKKVKSFFEKDITSFVKKHKTPLIVALVVVLLACVGMFVTYALYQVVEVKSIIGGTTGEISDLDIRIMTQERTANGVAISGSYVLYPYIPKAGYKYNAEKSYCSRGSVINYNASTYSADIESSGHDICYLYFDSTASLDISLDVYLQNINDDGEGAEENGEKVYSKLDITTMPSIGYVFNSENSYCEDLDGTNRITGSALNDVLSYSNADNEFTVNTNKKIRCSAYMDAMDVDINLKTYIQVKAGSTEYYEANDIPQNMYYQLNTTKSACTGTGSMDNSLTIKRQKVFISAAGRTSCVAYLDVGTGPIVEESSLNAEPTSITMTLNSSPTSTTPSKYYFSLDGKNYTQSTSNTYTFTGLTKDTNYTIYGYFVDTANRESRVITLNVTTPYSYVRGFEYSNAAQSETIARGGYYKLEVWGAQGGYRSSSTYSGLGGYSTGIIHFNAGDTVYVHTGGFPGSGTSGCGSTICPGGTNGGGYRYQYYGGGGGTDIRINQDSLYARVIVAGGGGSDGAATKKGMYGGGTTGGSSTESYSSVSNYGGKGGTQTYSGYSTAYTIATQTTTGLNSNTLANYAGGFGFGGGGVYLSNGYGGAGGGGWYGGSGNVPDGSGDDDRGGGGGSGYVYTESTASSCPSGCLLNSNHYLSNASTTAGNLQFISPTGAQETGHSGNGYARITYVGDTLPD